MCLLTPPMQDAVLFWSNVSYHGVDYEFRNYYASLGAVVATESGWSGNIHDYKLIFLGDPRGNESLEPIDDPVWWPEITSAAWQGRLHIASVGRFGAGFDHPWRAWVDGQSVVTGMGASFLYTTVALGSDTGPAFASDLTGSLASMTFLANMSVISGGTTLAKTPVSPFHPATPPDSVWLARNKVGNIDFLVSGCPHYNQLGIVAGEAEFWGNLLEVPV